MKAMRLHSFGGPEVLQWDDVDKPSAGESEVLVHVAAAGVNPVDYKIREGSFPKITSRDLPVTLGRDISGTIERGSDHEEIIALLDWRMGAYAEFVSVPRELCVTKPRTLNAIEAAAIPLAALTAWQGLFQFGQLQPGQRVLIHAGSGGVGHFAVQFAAHCGAEVISTASTANVEFVRRLGAGTVIDYTAKSFEDGLSGVDLVFDLLGGETRQRSWQVLRRDGMLVSTLGQPDESEAARYHVRTRGYMTEPNPAQLVEIGRLIDAGTVRPVITETFALRQAAEAHSYLEKRHPRGKVVLST